MDKKIKVKNSVTIKLQFADAFSGCALAIGEAGKDAPFVMWEK